MNTKKLFHQIALIVANLLFIHTITLHAQENGYWKFERIETSNKDHHAGQIHRQVTGNSESLTYSDENGNNGSKFIVKGNWSTPPGILNPGKNISISSNLKTQKFTPPKHHYQPIVDLFIHDYRLTQSFDEKKWNTTWDRLRVTGKSSDPKENASLSQYTSIPIPAPDKPGESMYIIGVKMGSSSANKVFYYIYRWKTGTPSVTNNEVVANEESWKLIDIKSEQTEKMPGNIKRYVEGEPGNLMYTNTFGNNGMYGVKVKAHWDKFPETMHPGVKATISCQTKVTELNPPAHRWQPRVNLYMHDYSTTSTFTEKRLNNNLAFVKLIPNSSEPNNMQNGNNNVVINPPESGTERPNYYIIRVKFGSTDGSKTFYYIYKWQE